MVPLVQSRLQVFSHAKIRISNATTVMPNVSVVIPNYNHARFLRQRVDSVLGQTYQDFELILLDDCSTDDSRSILSSYAGDPRVRIEFNEVNSGSPFKQWNKGVRLARGEYVWIAESDDYADGRLLQRLVGILDEQPEVAFAYCRSWRISENGQQDGFADSYLDYVDTRRWKADFRANGREECGNYFVCTNPVPNASAVVFRKAVYMHVGGADENLRMCGDWKLWAAMAFEGEVAYLSEPLNYYRAHDESVRSKSKLRGVDAAEALRVIRWILERVTPTEAVWENIRALTSTYWPWAVINMHVPLHVRLDILRDARAIDPHAMRKLIRPALVAVRLKLAKELRLVRQRFESRAS
jgi:glycosyltransferase involved in cell wall biosynthesis